MARTCDAASRGSLMAVTPSVAPLLALRDGNLRREPRFFEAAALRRADAELEYAGDAPLGGRGHAGAGRRTEGNGQRTRARTGLRPIACRLGEHVLARRVRAQKLHVGRVVGPELVRILVVDVVRT